MGWQEWFRDRCWIGPPRRGPVGQWNEPGGDGAVKEEPRFSRMIALVAGVVAVVILVFFAVGYALGKILL